MKNYCDRCKRIDEEVGCLWNLKLAGMNLVKGCPKLWDKPKEWNTPERKKVMHLLCGEGLDLCEDCWFAFLDFKRELPE